MSISKQTIKITVCMGTACYVLGGSELLLIEEALGDQYAGRVSVEGSPCLGYCTKGTAHDRAVPCVLVDGTYVGPIDTAGLSKMIVELDRALEH